MALSGLTPTLTVRRQSDGRFWTGNQDFTSVFTQVTMSAVNAVSIGGLYERTFDTTGLADNTYTLIASGTGAGNNPLMGELKVGGYVDNIDTSIQSIGTFATSPPKIILEGILTEEEKKKLFELITRNFDDLKKLLRNLSVETEFILSRVQSMDNSTRIKIESINNDIKSVGAFLEAQTIMMQQLDELRSLPEEVNQDA